jgi:multicomponent Na+:H+ antiporter subunit C
MSLVALAAVAVLFGTGTYLILQRMLSRIVIGLALISNGVNLLIVASAGDPGVPPLLSEGADPAAVADPLPQAMVLTAIVITFGITALLLALALRSSILTGSDAVEDDFEDRRIAAEEPEADDYVEEYREDADMHEEAT